MRRTLMGILVLAAAASVIGCASGTGQVAAGFQTSNIRTVAVAPVTGDIPSANAAMQIGNIVANDLRGKGYTVVSIGQGYAAAPDTIAAPVNPAGTYPPGSTQSLEGAVQPAPGGADGTMYVDVPQFKTEVSMNAKLVDNRTGQTVWSGSGSGNTEKLWVTIGSAAAGALAGTAVGGSQHRVAGAVGGGAAGGAGGYFLSPKEEYVAKKIAGDMFQTLPRAR